MTREAKEAATASKSKENNGMNSLEQMIMARQADRKKQQDSFFDDLAAKYCKPKKQKKGSTKSKK